MKTQRFELRLSDKAAKKLYVTSAIEDISQGEVVRRALSLYYHALSSDKVTLTKDGVETNVLIKNGGE